MQMSLLPGISAGSSPEDRRPLDHGRDLIETLEAIVEGRAEGYTIRDEPKLRRLAEELGITADGRDVMAVAADLVEECFRDFGSRRKEVAFLHRAPEKRRAIWKKLGMTPRGVDREIVEMMHRTHMGCDNDAVNTLVHAARTALSDGWSGSMIGTELRTASRHPDPRKARSTRGDQERPGKHPGARSQPVVSEMI
jgi:carbon-monoxide dehydrogenase catalytic subunit